MIVGYLMTSWTLGSHKVGIPFTDWLFLIFPTKLRVLLQLVTEMGALVTRKYGYHIYISSQHLRKQRVFWFHPSTQMAEEMGGTIMVLTTVEKAEEGEEER